MLCDRIAELFLSSLSLMLLCAALQGARVPVLVSGLLSNFTAEALACGMSHVAVVATQRGSSRPAGGGGGGGPVTRLLTWGKGARGQLGIGEAREDHLLPQVWWVCACSCWSVASGTVPRQWRASVVQPVMCTRHMMLLLDCMYHC
jgi:hypothetical protein